MMVNIYHRRSGLLCDLVKKSAAVALVALGAAGLACCFEWIPLLNSVSGGFAIIICALLAACLAAIIFPVKEENENDD